MWCALRFCDGTSKQTSFGCCLILAIHWWLGPVACDWSDKPDGLSVTCLWRTDANAQVQSSSLMRLAPAKPGVQDWSLRDWSLLSETDYWDLNCNHLIGKHLTLVLSGGGLERLGLSDQVRSFLFGGFLINWNAWNRSIIRSFLLGWTCSIRQAVSCCSDHVLHHALVLVLPHCKGLHAFHWSPWYWSPVRPVYLSVASLTC
jgi:hypothetical protein